MQARLLVATTCPTCSAPLDFTEGAHAVQCVYCRSNLLITGHKQILSYAISPTMTALQAIARVKQAYRERDVSCQVRHAHCYFLPYYRFTGHDLRWQQDVPHVSPSSLPPALYEALLMQQESIRTDWSRCRLSLRERYVEKNFLACSLPSVGLHSLGVRPAVLRLAPLLPEQLAQYGTIVPVTMGTKEALVQGMRSPTTPFLLARLVVGKTLSVIYFPYWLIEVERQDGTSLSIVDAVAHKVITTEAPMTLLSRFGRKPMRPAHVIAFRPLMCPNCGWDLPLTPDATVFFCAACKQAWYIMGSDLHTIAYEVAAVSAMSRKSVVRYLPFWRLQPQSSVDDATPYFLPAFRYRRLKLLVDLAKCFTCMQPPCLPCTDFTPTTLHPCFYDQGDAILLAHFLHKATLVNSHRHAPHGSPPRLSFAHATLTWFPFMRQGNYLVDPHTGLNLYENILL